MKTIFQSIPESVVSALGWTLVHSVWQGTLIAIIAVAGFAVLNKRSASLRYNFGIVLLSLQLIASIVTFLYYQLTIPLKNLAVNNLNSISAPVRNIPLNWQKVEYNLSMATKIQIWLNMHIYELVVCWLIGAAFLMLRFSAGWIYTERLRSSARIVMDKEWRVRFGVLTAKLNLSQSVEFRQTAKILTPMVIGALKPVVLIPFGFLTGFSTSQIEAILAHELAHIRRNDYLVNMLQSFVEVVFFFHPALWWISEKVRTEREHCCDDIALSVCNDKMSLAKALVKVAEWQSAPHLAMAFASKKPLLLNRISRVLGVTSKSPRQYTYLPAVLLGIGLIAGVSFYSVAQQEKKQTKKVGKTQIIRTKKEFTSSQLTFTDTIIKGKVRQDSSVKINDDDKRDSLAQAYHKLNNNIFSIGEIRSSLDGLTSTDVDMLSRQLPMLSDDNEKSSAELQKLQNRMEELNLQMEKENFEMERFQREMEKIEWKKDKLMDARSKLVEKRSALLHPDSKAGKPKLSDDDLEKQLNEFELQIKTQEQQITEFNTQIASARKEAENYKNRESFKSMELEIDEIQKKMDEIGTKMGLASFGLINYTPISQPLKAPRAPKAPKAPKMKGKWAEIAPPSPPKPAPKPAALKSIPSPPSPPAKK